MGYNFYKDTRGINILEIRRIQINTVNINRLQYSEHNDRIVKTAKLHRDTKLDRSIQNGKVISYNSLKDTKWQYKMAIQNGNTKWQSQRINLLWGYRYRESRRPDSLWGQRCRDSQHIKREVIQEKMAKLKFRHFFLIPI